MMEINNSYFSTAQAKRREMEFQAQASGANPYHYQHIIQFCDYADNLVTGAMEALKAQIPQLVAEAMKTPKVEIEVDEKSYKTAKKKIEDFLNMIFKR